MPEQTADVRDVLHAAVEAVGGEDRPGQIQMAEAVRDALAQEKHLLVQAGTGTGKSHIAVAIGLIGSLGGRIVVASPLYKQHIELSSGECLESPAYSVQAHRVSIQGGQVRVALA